MLRVLQYALLCDDAFPCSIDRRSSSSVAFVAAAGAMESSFLLYCSSPLSETRVCMLSLLPCMQRLRFVFSLHALARCPACSHHLSLSLSLAISFSLSLSLSLSPSLSLSHSTSLSLSVTLPLMPPWIPSQTPFSSSRGTSTSSRVYYSLLFCLHGPVFLISIPPSLPVGLRVPFIVGSTRWWLRIVARR